MESPVDGKPLTVSGFLPYKEVEKIDMRLLRWIRLSLKYCASRGM
jgi:hypothetical protein